MSKVSNRRGHSKSVSALQAPNLSQHTVTSKERSPSSGKSEDGLLVRWWNAPCVDSHVLLAFWSAFFLLLAYDWIVQVARAPKYGLNNFNVPHTTLLNLQILAPNEAIMSCAWLVMSFLAIRAACFIISQVELLLLTVIYGYAYFISQMDNYQHHYFLFLVLVIVNFVDVKSLLNLRHIKGNVASPEIRLVLIQTSVVYFWTTVTKLNDEWYRGTLLKTMVGPQFILNVQLTEHMTNGVLSENMIWIFVAISTIIAEIFATIGLHVPATHGLLFYVGLGMHLTMHFSRLQIGFFSFYMVLLYFLISPWYVVKVINVIVDTVFRWLDRLGHYFAFLNSVTVSFLANAIIAVIGFYFWFTHIIFPAISTIVGCCCCILSLSWLYHSLNKSISGVHLTFGNIVAVFFIVLSCIYSGKVDDYYVQRASDMAKFGQFDKAIQNYKTIISINPNNDDILANLGIFYDGDRKMDVAFSYYEQAYAINKENLKAITGLATHYAFAKNNEKACEMLAILSPMLKKTTTMVCDGRACEEKKTFAKFASKQYERIRRSVVCK